MEQSPFINFIQRLNKPLIVFDTETTGTDVSKDRIVSIATTKITSEAQVEKKYHLINPEITIPPESSDVHGITNDMVSDKPNFKRISKGIYEYFKGCVVCGFNSNKFDVPLLVNELERCGIYPLMSDFELIDVSVLYNVVEPRTLSDLYKKFTGKVLEDAHSADSDVSATLELFECLYNKYPEIQLDTKELEKKSNYDLEKLDFFSNFVLTEEKEIVFGFGKNKGKKVVDNEDYLLWMLRSDFSFQTKELIKKILKQEKNESSKR